MTPFLQKSVRISALFLLLPTTLVSAHSILWPTPNKAFAKGKGPDSFIQPTISGRVESGQYGYIRDNHRKFHKGIDIKPVQKRDPRGEATDPIYAALPGKVAYINQVAGNSTYGRYIVLEHCHIEPCIYTLYAHLKSVQSHIRIGTKVKMGDTLGTMGRSAGGYQIPKERAHLHFEIGLRTSNNFPKWYKKQHYFSNNHGIWNGLNLLPFDALDFFNNVRDGKVKGVDQYLRKLPKAFTIKVHSSHIPDFIKRYPTLASYQIPEKDILGWEIDFTWFGMPVKWNPLMNVSDFSHTKEKYTIVSYNSKLLKGFHSTEQLTLQKNSPPKISKKLNNTLDILFTP